VSSSVVKYEGAEMGMYVSSRYADANLGDEWMILLVSMTGEANDSVRVERENISLRGPDGRRYPLPSQPAFREAFGQLQLQLRAAETASPPPGRFSGYRKPCGRWFFAEPGAGIGRDYLDLTPQWVCSGPLVFLIPGGVQPGPWTLAIDLEESHVRAPFTLGENR